MNFIKKEKFVLMNWRTTWIESTSASGSQEQEIIQQNEQIEEHSGNFDSLINHNSTETKEKDWKTYKLSKITSWRVYNDSLQEVDDKVYIAKSSESWKMDILIDNTLANTRVFGVPIDYATAQETVNYIYNHVNDSWFTEKWIQYVWHKTNIEKEYDSIKSTIKRAIVDWTFDSTELLLLFNNLPKNQRELLENEIKQLKLSKTELEELNSLFNWWSIDSVTWIQTAEVVNTTIENPIPQIILQTANIKVFLNQAITSPDAYNDINLNDIKGLVYWSVLNKSKYDGEEIEAFATEVWNLLKAYKEWAHKTPELDKIFNSIESAWLVAAVSAFTETVKKVNNYKEKPFSELNTLLAKENDNISKGKESAKEKKTMILGAIVQKMTEDWLYLKRNTTTNKFELASVKWIPLTAEQNNINNLTTTDLQSIVILISANENDVLSWEWYESKTPSIIFNNLVNKYNAEFKNNTWQTFSTKDFVVDNVLRSQARVEQNIKDFTVVADKKIAELIKENQANGASVTKIKENLNEIQKLEIAKTFVTDNTIFEPKAVWLAQEMIGTPLWKTALTWIKAADFVSAQWFMKKVENWEFVSAMMWQIPKVVLFLIFNWLVNKFTNEWSVWRKMTKGIMVATLWASIYADLAKRWIVPKASTIFGSKKDPTWVEATSSVDTGIFNISNWLRSLRDWATVKPDWMNPMFKQSYINILDINDSTQALDRKPTLERIFMLASNDPTFLGKNLKTDVAWNMEAWNVLGLFSQFSIDQFNTYGITSVQVSDFVKMFNNKKEGSDSTVLDWFIDWNSTTTKSIPKNYFSWEKKFNLKIDSQLQKLPWLPKTDIFDIQWQTPDEIKNSLRNKVSIAIDYGLTAWSDAETLIKDIGNLNDFWENNKKSIVAEIITKLETIQNDPTNTAFASNAALQDIITEYKNLEWKYTLLWKIEEYRIASGYWYISSIIGETGVWGWTKEITQNGVANKAGTKLSSQEIETKITEGNSLITEIQASIYITAEQKTKAIEAINNTIQELQESQITALSTLAYDENSTATERTTAKASLTAVYTDQINNNPNEVLKDVQDIAKNLKGIVSASNDTRFYTKTLSAHSFYSEIDVEDIHKLRMLQTIVPTTPSPLKTLIDTSLNNFDKFKQNLIDFAKNKKDELDKLNNSLTILLTKPKNTVKQEDVTKIRDQIEEIRKNIYIWDNMISATWIKAWQTLANWTWLSSNLANKPYSNFFQSMEKRVQNIDSSYSITDFPDEATFILAYNKINQLYIDKKIDVLDLKTFPTNFKDKVQVEEYITSLWEASNNIDQAKWNDIKWMTLDDYKNSLEAEIVKFTNQLKVEIKGSINETEIKYFENIYSTFNSKAWSEWFRLLWNDYWVKEVIREKRKELIYNDNIAKYSTIKVSALPQNIKAPFDELNIYIKTLPNNIQSKYLRHFDNNRTLDSFIKRIDSVMNSSSTPSNLKIKLEDSKKEILKQLSK